MALVRCISGSWVAFGDMISLIPFQTRSIVSWLFSELEEMIFEKCVSGSKVDFGDIKLLIFVQILSWSCLTPICCVLRFLSKFVWNSSYVKPSGDDKMYLSLDRILFSKWVSGSCVDFGDIKSLIESQTLNFLGILSSSWEDIRFSKWISGSFVDFGDKVSLMIPQMLSFFCISLL